MAGFDASDLPPQGIFNQDQFSYLVATYMFTWATLQQQRENG